MGRHKHYIYTVCDIADLGMVSEDVVRQAVCRGVLDMEDMESVYRWIISKRPMFGRGDK